MEAHRQNPYHHHSLTTMCLLENSEFSCSSGVAVSPKEETD